MSDTRIEDLKAKSIKGGLWNFLTLIVNQFRNFVVTLILARLLTPADFGLVSMAMVFNSILDFVADFGFGTGIIRKKNITEIQTSTIFWFNLIVGALCTLFVIALSPFLAGFYQMQDLAPIVYVTSLSFFVSSFSTLQTALFQRKLDFRSPFIARLISGIISGVVGIAMAVWGCGVWSLVFASLTGWLIYSITIWFMSDWRPSRVFNLREVKDLISFGWKMTLSTFINRIVRQLDTFIIGRLYSAATLGLFNRAQALNLLVIDYAFSSIRGVVLPTLSKLQGDTNALRQNVEKLLHLISFLTFLFAGLMYLCADDLIILLYGHQWIGAIGIFKILGLFSISLCLPVVYDSIMAITSNMSMYLVVSIVRNVLTIAAIPIGIYYGFMGYVWAISFAGAINLLPYVVSAQKCIRLSILSQIATILRYAMPFLLILYVWSHISPHNESVHVMIPFKVLYFTVLYVGINILMRNSGLISSYSLIRSIILRKKHQHKIDSHA